MAAREIVPVNLLPLDLHVQNLSEVVGRLEHGQRLRLLPGLDHAHEAVLVYPVVFELVPHAHQDGPA